MAEGSQDPILSSRHVVFSRERAFSGVHALLRDDGEQIASVHAPTDWLCQVLARITLPLVFRFMNDTIHTWQDVSISTMILNVMKRVLRLVVGVITDFGRKLWIWVNTEEIVRTVVNQHNDLAYYPAQCPSGF
jgi:hypothetical protein